MEVYEIIQKNPEIVKNDDYKSYKLMSRPYKHQIFGRIVFILLEHNNEKIIVTSRLEYTYDKENKQIVIYLKLENGYLFPIEIVEVQDTVKLSLKRIRQKYREVLPKVKDMKISFSLNDLTE